MSTLTCPLLCLPFAKDSRRLAAPRIGHAWGKVWERKTGPGRDQSQGVSGLGAARTPENGVSFWTSIIRGKKLNRCRNCVNKGRGP